MRPDLQAKAFFEKLDNDHYPRTLKQARVSFKKDPSELAEFEKINSLRKVYDEFVSANNAYKEEVENKENKRKINTARVLAKEKHKKFIAKFLTCLPVVAKHCPEFNDDSEEFNIRDAVTQFEFRKEMAARFQLPEVDQKDPAVSYGVIAEVLDRGVKVEVDKACKMITDEEMFKTFVQDSNILMLKLALIYSHLEDQNKEPILRADMQQKFGRYLEKLLTERKKFIEALAVAEEQKTPPNERTRLDDCLKAFIENFNQYQKQLPEMKAIVNKNFLAIKNLVEAADKKIEISDEKSNLAQEAVSKRIKAIELFEAMKKNQIQTKSVLNQAFYLLEKLVEWQRSKPAFFAKQADLDQNKLDEAKVRIERIPISVAEMIKKQGFFTFIPKDKIEGDSYANLLKDFDDNNAVVKSPQSFLEDEIKLFKQAEIKFAGEKAAYENELKRPATYISGNKAEILKRRQKRLEQINNFISKAEAEFNRAKKRLAFVNDYIFNPSSGFQILNQA